MFPASLYMFPTCCPSASLISAAYLVFLPSAVGSTCMSHHTYMGQGPLSHTCSIPQTTLTQLNNIPSHPHLPCRPQVVPAQRHLVQGRPARPNTNKQGTCSLHGKAQPPADTVRQGPHHGSANQPKSDRCETAVHTGQLLQH